MLTHHWNFKMLYIGNTKFVMLWRSSKIPNLNSPETACLCSHRARHDDFALYCIFNGFFHWWKRRHCTKTEFRSTLPSVLRFETFLSAENFTFFIHQKSSSSRFLIRKNSRGSTAVAGAGETKLINLASRPYVGESKNCKNMRGEGRWRWEY